MNAYVAMTSSVALLSTVSAAHGSASQASSGRSAVTLCESNPANAADGITLVNTVDVAPVAGTRVIQCKYQKTLGGPLPDREFPFRVRCPRGSKLVFPGFNFSGVTAGRQRLAALIPNTSSDGYDFVDVVIRTDEPSAFDVTTTVVCRI